MEQLQENLEEYDKLQQLASMYYTLAKNIYILLWHIWAIPTYRVYDSMIIIHSHINS